MDQINVALDVGDQIQPNQEVSAGHSGTVPRLEDVPRTERAGTTMEEVLDAESEAGLLKSGSDGSLGAITRLYTEHWAAGVAFARSLTRDLHDAEEITSLAFMKVFSAVQNGKGPSGPLRPYLYRTIRTCIADLWRRRSHEYTTDQLPDRGSDDPAIELIENARDRELASKAMASLPRRWQQVIWHAEVAGLKPREVAPVLSLEPNAVSALLRRARRGLREAYLVEYIRSTSPDECHALLPLLAKAVTESASARDSLIIRRHTRSCPDCGRALGRLRLLHSTMRAAGAPLTLGAMVTAGLSGCSEVGFRAFHEVMHSPFVAATLERIDSALAHKSPMAKAVISCMIAMAKSYGVRMGTHN